jgi:hypothetical protein
MKGQGFLRPLLKKYLKDFIVIDLKALENTLV